MMDTNGEAIVSASAGGQFTMVVSEDGRLWGTGNNDAGQLGLGDTKMRRKLTVVVPPCPTVVFRKVSCGLNHSGAVSVSGEVYTFGWGLNGRLGHGDCNKRCSPCLVEKLKDELVFVMDVACGGASTGIVSDQGDVWSWGWNFYGQCGIPLADESSASNSPSVFDDYPSAPTSEGGDEGEGGGGNVLLPRLTLSGKVVTSLSLGFAHAAAISAVGELYTWGFNEEGQLGLGHEQNQFEPHAVTVEMPDPDGSGETLSTKERGRRKLRVLGVACGHTHTAIIVSKLTSVQNDLRREEGAKKR